MQKNLIYNQIRPIIFAQVTYGCADSSRERASNLAKNSGKKNSGEENLCVIHKVSENILCLNLHKLTFLHCCSYFRFVALEPFEGQYFPHFFTFCRRFTPKLLCEQDRVPLPFAVAKERTCALGDNADMRVSCPRESSRKIQFTMHVAVSDG